MMKNISPLVRSHSVALLGVLLMFAFSQLEKKIPFILTELSVEPFSLAFKIIASVPFFLWIFIPVLLFFTIRKKPFPDIKKHLHEAVIAIIVVDFVLIPLTVLLVVRQDIPITIRWVVQILFIHALKDFLLWISYRLVFHLSSKKSE